MSYTVPKAVAPQCSFIRGRSGWVVTASGGVDIEQVASLIEGQAALGLLNLFSGGALEQFAIFSLGIMPYITASIIMQLLQGVVPAIERCCVNNMRTREAPPVNDKGIVMKKSITPI